MGADPVPQALVITGLVVAFAATALGVALVVRLAQETSRAPPHADEPTGIADGRADP
jgi:multicomponent Na+:H+ antiporter subunit C